MLRAVFQEYISVQGGHSSVCPFHVTMLAWTRVSCVLTIYVFKCPYLNSSMLFFFFVVTKNPYGFQCGCLGDHFEKCFLILTLFVTVFCSFILKGCAAIVMIFPVHEKKVVG